MDGRSDQAHAVRLHLDLHIPLAEVQWPQRTRHGQRIAHFSGGGLVQAEDAATWDAWFAASGQRESLVATMQQSWRSVLLSAALLLGLLGMVYVWGLPRLNDALVAAIRSSVEASLGEASLAAIDSQLMQASQLSAAEHLRIQTAWQKVVAALPATQVPEWRLLFRHSKIGPNAFALPGGNIIMTDELVKLVDGDTQAICAVLTHELGHLQNRDGLHMLVDVAVLGSISSALLGDFSTLLAALPALLGQSHYSRQAEHQAEVAALQTLKAVHISPAAMLTFFDRLEHLRHRPGKPTATDTAIGIAFASHPTDAARIAFFREAGQ